MPSSPRLVVLAVLSALAIAAGGCGSDSGPDGPSRAAEPEPVADLCSVVSDERLTEIAGRAQTVGDVSTQGTTEICRTVRDSGDALQVSWTVQRPVLGAEDFLDSEAVGGLLDRSAVELSGAGEPVGATLVAGEVAGTPLAKVVVELDGRVLVVEAASMDLGIDEPVPDEELRRVAIEIAEEYVRAGLPAPSPPS